VLFYRPVRRSGIDNGSLVSTGDLSGLGDGAYASGTSTPPQALVFLSFHQRAYTVSIEVMIGSLDSDLASWLSPGDFAFLRDPTGAGFSLIAPNPR
jgi:hypothetical protein